jgi:hypothetical protein
MKCPHCEGDTDPTLAYCMICGEQIELDPERVKEHLEKDEQQEAIEFMEGQTRGALYACLFLLVCVVAFRLIVVRPVVGDVGPGFYGSPKVVEEKNLEPNPALEPPLLTLDIPEWKPNAK